MTEELVKRTVFVEHWTFSVKLKFKSPKTYIIDLPRSISALLSLLFYNDNIVWNANTCFYKKWDLWNFTFVISSMIYPPASEKFLNRNVRNRGARITPESLPCKTFLRNNFFHIAEKKVIDDVKDSLAIIPMPQLRNKFFFCLCVKSKTVSVSQNVFCQKQRFN